MGQYALGMIVYVTRNFRLSDPSNREEQAVVVCVATLAAWQRVPVEGVKGLIVTVGVVVSVKVVVGVALQPVAAAVTVELPVQPER